MKHTITTRNDLRNWVLERLHDADNAEIEATTEAIAAHPQRPMYGQDWAKFFRELPENLCDLL
jgi:hypothetical protein